MTRSVGARRFGLAKLATGVALTTGTAALVSAPGAAAAPSSPLPESIRTLGYANRFAVLDTELRYDGVITVPKGVTISDIKYAYYGDGNATHRATERPRGTGGINDEYEIIDTSTNGDQDLIAFHLRGDINVDAGACPKGSRTYPIKISISLSNKETKTVSPEVEVLNKARCGGDPDGTSRPFVRLPWDTHWGGAPPAYSQGGFGYVSDDGKVPGDKFIVDLVNLRQGAKGLSCNSSDKVYYQFVREDGTPSNLTPAPKSLSVVGHKETDTRRKVVLPAQDFRAAGDKPGYYKFLVWPQAQNTTDGTCGAGWNPENPADAFQIGSVYYDYRGTQPAAVPLIDPRVGAAAIGVVGAALLGIRALGRRRRAASHGRRT